MKKFKLRFSWLGFVFIFCTENHKTELKIRNKTKIWAYTQNIAKYANVCKKKLWYFNKVDIEKPISIWEYTK